MYYSQVDVEVSRVVHILVNPWGRRVLRSVWHYCDVSVPDELPPRFGSHRFHSVSTNKA